MMRNSQYDGDFCCASMTSAQRDARWMLDYDHDDKSHYMIQVWPNANNLFVFNYCPWCAKNIRPPFLDEPDDAE